MSMSAGEFSGQRGGRPLLPDEVAQLPDLPAAEEVPEEVAARLAEHRLHIAGVTEKPEVDKPPRGGAEDDGWDLLLPSGAFLGRPGQTAERLERHEHELPKLGET